MNGTSDNQEPVRVRYQVRDAKQLAWILFHEGFRCGYGARSHGQEQMPAHLEPYVMELFKLVSAEIVEQNPPRHD